MSIERKLTEGLVRQFQSGEVSRKQLMDTIERMGIPSVPIVIVGSSLVKRREGFSSGEDVLAGFTGGNARIGNRRPPMPKLQRAPRQ